MARDLRQLAARVQQYKRVVLTQVPAVVSETIVDRLQDEGPNWTGEFMNAWRILNGETTAEPVLGRAPNRDGPIPAYSPAEPIRQVATLNATTALISPVPNIYAAYTLSNASKHRLVAMDIDPGYVRQPPRTAPRDWWMTFINGGQLETVARATVAQGLRSFVL